MPQLSQPVTILGIDEKTGVGKNGPWKLHKIKASDGNSYDTFDVAVAQKARSAGQNPVSLAYDQRDNNGFTNYDLKDVLVPDATNAVAVTVQAPAVIQEAQPQASTFQQDKEARITRLASARTAFEYAASAGLDVEGAFDLAVQIERYAHDQWVPGDRELAALSGSVQSTRLPWDDAA